MKMNQENNNKENKGTSVCLWMPSQLDRLFVILKSGLIRNLINDGARL
jgi:hypothetical protein